MTYPDPRYLGEGGEVTAVYRPTSTPPDVTYADGGTADYLAKGSATDGLFGLYRWNMSGPPSGPGPHFHRALAESFYVLLGTIRIYDGKEWLETKPGDFIHVPIGGIHGFRNESGEPASMLIHFAPGAPREAYFEGLARWSVEGRPEAEEVDAFYRAHDNIWL